VASYESRLAGLAATHRNYRMRAWAALIGGAFAAIAVTVMGAWFIAPVALVIAGLVAVLMLRVASRFQPVSPELLGRGRATPAVIVSARPVGPHLRASGIGSSRKGEQRTELCIEVRPEGQRPYRVLLTTFDAPRPVGLDGRPITVYVDPAEPGRIHPDWRAIAAEF
jgi:hypothetical protein